MTGRAADRLERGLTMCEFASDQGADFHGLWPQRQFEIARRGNRLQTGSASSMPGECRGEQPDGLVAIPRCAGAMKVHHPEIRARVPLAAVRITMQLMRDLDPSRP